MCTVTVLSTFARWRRLSREGGDRIRRARVRTACACLPCLSALKPVLVFASMSQRRLRNNRSSVEEDDHGFARPLKVWKRYFRFPSPSVLGLQYTVERTIHQVARKESSRTASL